MRDDIFNIEPIGSGNFVFEKREKNDAETTYFLKANKKNKPYIDKITYHSFNNLDLFEDSKIYNNKSKIKNISSIYPSDMNLSEYNIHRINIPKINFLFFNLKSNSIISDINIRKAISVAISKDEIIDNALNSNALIANTFRP
jgi:ABC-type transport system substrate-binding protein